MRQGHLLNPITEDKTKAQRKSYSWHVGIEPELPVSQVPALSSMSQILLTITIITKGELKNFKYLYM